MKKNPRKNPLAIRYEYLKASIRAKVKHPFRIIKCPFGFVKARYKEMTPTGDVVRSGEPGSSGTIDKSTGTLRLKSGEALKRANDSRKGTNFGVNVTMLGR